MTAFLNVTSSLSDRKWIGPSCEQDRLASSIAQINGLSQLTGLLLAKRNIEPTQVKSFLTPKLREEMPDPYILNDVKKTSQRLIKAIINKQKICIFADYDVDGTVSASILYLWFKAYNIIPEVYIPDRVKEGYGPNTKAMEVLAKRNDIIICVDCGTVAHDALNIAQKEGAETIILDHHQSDSELPPAFAVVNPKRKDETEKIDYLCAAGVVFIVLVAVNRLLREQKKETYDLMSFLDLVALATVADVVPLIKLNRAIVSQGLRIFAKRNRPGLVALADSAGLKAKPDSSHLSFLIAPRINAAGRLADANLAVKLFTSETLNEAYPIATELNKLNSERRSIEESILEQALDQIKTVSSDKSLIWVASKDWHPGVIGIVAARLKEKFNLPVIVLYIDENGIAVGSARSIVGIDIGDKIRKVHKSGHFLAGGGHALAAGLKCRQELLIESMSVLENEIKKTSFISTTSQKLEIDSLITTQGVTTELVEEINGVGPFGSGNPAPRVVIANCQIKNLKILNGKHMKFVCQDRTQKRLEAIFFNSAESVAGQRLNAAIGESFHLCGKLEINDWGGYRRVVLQVEDVSLIQPT